MRVSSHMLQQLFRNSQNQVFLYMIATLTVPVLLGNQGRYHHNGKQQKLLKRSTLQSEIFSSQSKNLSIQVGVRESHQTQSTNHSFKEEPSDVAADEVYQSLLNFTFYPSYFQSLPLQQNLIIKNPYKYSNKSIQCVIFYALLFNQLHLEEIKKNLPKITSASLRCYNMIRESILQYDEIIAKRQLQDFIFPHSAFRLIENKALCLKTRKQWLRNLIDKMESFIVSDLLKSLLKDQSTNALAYASIPKNKNKNSEAKLQQLTKRLGIRVKYQSQFKLWSCGSKSSYICVHLRWQTQSNSFQLKRVSCYQDQQ